MAWLGLLMLDTRFPRPPGDVGHPDTFAFEVRRQGVPGATPLRAVRGDTAALVRPFADAARSLVEQGAAAISTSCGFLVLLQRELQATVPVPVWTSALLALPGLPRPGVVTADAASLGAAHLLAAGADAATPVAGLAPGCHLHRTLLHDQPTLDTAQAEADTVAAAQQLCRQHPGVETIVLECTNLPPYAAAVQRATGRPVHDITTLLRQRWLALETP